MLFISNVNWAEILLGQTHWHYAVKKWVFLKAFSRGLDSQLVCAALGEQGWPCVCNPAGAGCATANRGGSGWGTSGECWGQAALWHSFPGRASFLIPAQALLQIRCTLSPIWMPAQPLPSLSGLVGVVAELRTMLLQGTISGKHPHIPLHCWLLSV